VTSKTNLLAPSHASHLSLPAGALVVFALVVLLLPTSAGLTATVTPTAASPSAAFLSGGAMKLLDDSSIKDLLAGKLISVLTDTALPGPSTGYQRTYTVNIVATVAVPLLSVAVTTSPVTVMSQPAQLPGGADAMPPFSLWSFTILVRGHNDTANWSSNPVTGTLTRTAPWEDTSYTITGRATQTLSISVLPTAVAGQVAPASGFVANGIFSTTSDTSNSTAFPGLAAATHPGIVRIGITSMGVQISWNASNNSVSFKWTGLDRLINFSESMGANILLSLPAGSWGDGNTLPVGMPLNPLMPVTFYGTTGYFPTVTAYTKYVEALAEHVHAMKEHVMYWSIGNEVPRVNVSEVATFIKVFNAAELAVHKYLPAALVGTDVMMDPDYITQFAKGSPNTQFLSFHFYAVTGMCLQNGVYCPPQGGSEGTPDQDVVDRSTEFGTMLAWDPPLVARDEWHNLTGKWLPVLDSESNLNHEGGTLATAAGTDPRIQTLFGAQWLAGLYIDGTQQGVKAIVYYTLAGPSAINSTPTSAYGGWGFQMIRINGTSTDLYAPFWAATMWGRAVPPQSAALLTTGSVDAVAEAQAYRVGTGISVVAVNHVNATVRFTISFPGQSLVPTNLTLLDHRSYSETWDAVTHQEILSKSGLLPRVRTTNPVTFVLQGYGVAVLTEAPTGGHPGVHFASGALFGESGLCPVGNVSGTTTFSTTAWSGAGDFGQSERTPWTGVLVAATSRPVLPSC
jgi:hypothetical protein